jgi:hypothetical protein
LPEDLDREAVPARRTARSEVEEAVRRICQEPHGRCGDVARPGRRAALIVDNLQLGTLGSEPKHGEQEVVPAARVHPTRTQDQVSAAARLDRTLPLQLAAAVHA